MQEEAEATSQDAAQSWVEPARVVVEQTQTARALRALWARRLQDRRASPALPVVMAVLAAFAAASAAVEVESHQPETATVSSTRPLLCSRVVPCSAVAAVTTVPLAVTTLAAQAAAAMVTLAARAALAVAPVAVVVEMMRAFAGRSLANLETMHRLAAAVMSYAAQTSHPTPAANHNLVRADQVRAHGRATREEAVAETAIAAGR